MSESCLYVGSVRHRRHTPRAHAFRYPLFLAYLDLAELDTVFRGRWLWSARRFALAWFRRRDHLGSPAMPLDQAVRDLVERHSGRRPQGPIRLLTHLRYFGYCFNPVSFYYCFDAQGEQVETVVAEVNNTPWGERHCYVLDGEPRLRYRTSKAMHVSPFMPMDARLRMALHAARRAARRPHGARARRRAHLRRHARACASGRSPTACCCAFRS